MATVVLKKKPVQAAPEPKPDVMVSEMAELIDWLGQNQKKLEQTAAKIKELSGFVDLFKKKQTELAKHFEEAKDDDEKFVELGEEFQAEFGTRGKSRSIKDLEKAKELLGTETFMKVASVTLKDLDAYLSPPELEQVLETTRTGRTVKITKRIAE